MPPDVVDEGPAGVPVPAGAPTVRNIIVPHDIAAVPRRSPIKARKRTPWHPVPESHDVVDRAGSREWFTDRLFVESKQRHLPAACSTSAIVHGVVLILVLLFLAARAGGADLAPRRHTDVSLRMPATLSLPPAVVVSPPARTAAKPPSPAAAFPRQAPLRTPAREIPSAVPLEAPLGIEAEPATLEAAAIEGTGDAAQAGGVPGGNGSGLAVEAAAPPPPLPPLRVGEGIDRPRKIKDVKPVYPTSAQVAQVRGNVLIEATIGADGKVHNARVLSSIAALDQAALDAVRQWEYEPSRVNGVAVAVTMVVIVSFALL